VSTTVAFDRLTKRFGATVAVEGLTETVEPGRVTGFLGPNGAGKTTTLRMLLGLITPTAGAATFDGKRYDELTVPTREVGTLLEATGFHPGRSAVNHLRVLAVAAGLPRSRPTEVLELVGLAEVAGRKVGQFSLGMRQRLGLAAALLGDPPVLVLDEPANGLDPQGIHWLRTFLRGLAQEGRTVLVSSHMLPEMEQTADELIVLANGRLIRQGVLADLQSEGGGGTRVRTPQAEQLAALLSQAGLPGRYLGPEELQVDAQPERVGELAAQHGVVLHRLAPTAGGLEDVFLSLTSGTGPTAGSPPPPPAPVGQAPR